VYSLTPAVLSVSLQAAFARLRFGQVYHQVGSGRDFGAVGWAHTDIKLTHVLFQIDTFSIALTLVTDSPSQSVQQGRLAQAV
jgi:hypothetical protein